MGDPTPVVSGCHGSQLAALMQPANSFFPNSWRMTVSFANGVHPEPSFTCRSSVAWARPIVALVIVTGPDPTPADPPPPPPPCFARPIPCGRRYLVRSTPPIKTWRYCGPPLIDGMPGVKRMSGPVAMMTVCGGPTMVGVPGVNVILGPVATVTVCWGPTMFGPPGVKVMRGPMLGVTVCGKVPKKPG